MLASERCQFAANGYEIIFSGSVAAVPEEIHLLERASRKCRRPNSSASPIFIFQVTLVLLHHNDIRGRPDVQLSKLSHSLQNRLRQAKFLRVLIYLSDITMASEQLLATLERNLGECCKKFFIYSMPRNLNIYP